MSAYDLLLNASMILAAIVLLWKGSQWLVEAASRIARFLGMSDLAIGLTVVSLGTSAPEFAVTINAAQQGRADISVGNIVGSNIFNMGFILGGCAVVRAIQTTPKMVWRDGLLLVIVSLLLIAFSYDGVFSRTDGAIFLTILVAYIARLFWKRQARPEEEVAGGKATWKHALFLLAGIAGVVGGGHLLVHAASEIARGYGVSEWVIAVTIVAAGTSLPELATSLTAALKGHHGISAGNLIGSDIFNLLGVLGVAGLIRPLEVHESAFGSLIVLVIMVAVVTVFLRTGWQLSQREGVILVGANLIRWVMDFMGKG